MVFYSRLILPSLFFLILLAQIIKNTYYLASTHAVNGTKENIAYYIGLLIPALLITLFWMRLVSVLTVNKAPYNQSYSQLKGEECLKYVTLFKLIAFLYVIGMVGVLMPYTVYLALEDKSNMSGESFLKRLIFVYSQGLILFTPATILSGMFLHYLYQQYDLINLGLIRDRQSIVILKKGGKQKDQDIQTESYVQDISQLLKGDDDEGNTPKV